MSIIIIIIILLLLLLSHIMFGVLFDPLRLVPVSFNLLGNKTQLL